MNEQEKKNYLENYKKAKEKGVPFFPDIIFKDAVVTLIVFIVLVALAYFVGAPVEERANPNDTSYTPRPEWYFLFLFQLLKYFPGNLEVIGAMILPGLFILLLIALPFIDKSAKRHFRNRPFASLTALAVVVGIGLLTVLAVVEAPPPQEAVVVDQAAALYAANCANCHGESIDAPPGTDLHQVIAAGTHEGMPAWGGDLSTDEIDQLAGFIMSHNGSAIYVQQCETCHEKGYGDMVQAWIDDAKTARAKASAAVEELRKSVGGAKEDPRQQLADQLQSALDQVDKAGTQHNTDLADAIYQQVVRLAGEQKKQ